MRRPHAAIASVLGLLAIVLPTLGGCSRPDAPAPTPAPAQVVKKIGKPPTDEDGRAVGVEIAKAVESGDAATLDRIIDWDSLYQRSTAGIEATQQFRDGFVKGLDRSRVQGKGFSSAVVDAVEKGGSYTLLHAHTEDRRPWLLFRLLLPDSGVNYHDLLLARRPDGSVKVEDIYVHLSGECLSETFRRPYIQASAQQNAGLFSRLTGADRAFAKNYQKLGEMGQASRNGKFAEAIAIFESFPPELKKEKSVLLIRLLAAQKLDDDNAEYERSIEDFLRTFPGEACINLMSIDYYLLNEQYAKALESIDRVNRAVLGDPYLNTMRAGVLIEQGDLGAARDAAKKALDSEPGLLIAYWNLVTISLKEKDHVETLRNLRLIRDKFQVEIGALAAEPLYEEFARSPQYKEWLEGDRGGVGIEGGKPSP